MKVKCINNKNLIEPREGSLLTINKWYQILEIETDFTTKQSIYWIIDDTKTKRFFDSERFEPSKLALDRFNKLKDLGI